MEMFEGARAGASTLAPTSALTGGRMNTHIDPIPTRYAGHLCRSRMEARWMVFFDALEIKFWYEPEGFPLKIGWYLPDFFLPQVNLYAEVKPVEMGPISLKKCVELCLMSGNGIISLVGPPDFRTYRAMIVLPDGLLDSESLLLDIDYHTRRYYTQERRFFSNPGDQFSTEDDFTSQYREAVFASRMARFEG
ncbi:MAG: hypothetical protein V1790_17345 [Planctomycetota bacterium]